MFTKPLVKRINTHNWMYLSGGYANFSHINNYSAQPWPEYNVKPKDATQRGLVWSLAIHFYAIGRSWCSKFCSHSAKHFTSCQIVYNAITRHHDNAWHTYKHTYAPSTPGLSKATRIVFTRKIVFSRTDRVYCRHSRERYRHRLLHC